MNLNLLQAFQTVINEHGLGDDNARVQMLRRDDIGSCYPRVVRAHAPTKESNQEVRTAFKLALTSAFGVERLEELPKEVKGVLKIGDFKLSKNGEVRSSRPLTMRRIKAVMNAVKDVTKSTLHDSREIQSFEQAFISGFDTQERDVVERALSRIAIVSGREAMKFTLPGGINIAVPLSSLTAYTRFISQDRLTASIDDLRDQIQRDIIDGCAIYECLKSGRQCEQSAESARRLRHYLSFMALASGKSGSRVISVPDENGMVADFLKHDGSKDARRLYANDSISGAKRRAFFVSDLQCLGSSVAPMRQMDVERHYRKLAENRQSSRLLNRTAEQGGLTIAQMQANVKAELARISTVAEEELLLDVRKELGVPDLSMENAKAVIGNTKAFDDFYSYRCALSEFLLYLQSNRADLDHVEARIGDEIILVDNDLKKLSREEDINHVMSPRKVSVQREIEKEVVCPKTISAQLGSTEWCRGLVDSYAEGGFRNSLNIIIRCMRFGLHPDGKAPPENLSSTRNEEEMFAKFAEYIKGLDKEWLADFEWYIKSSAIKADNEAIRLGYNGPRREGERPIWSALKRSQIDYNFPALFCHEMENLFKYDNLELTFDARVLHRPMQNGVIDPGNIDIASRASLVAWGFGTYDIGRILIYFKDCGYQPAEMTAADLNKLSSIAALTDYRLDEAPVFIQRQTGKSISEVTTKDIEALFRLKRSNCLNDKGCSLKGTVGEIAAILKGDKLPSMTAAKGDDVMRLLGAMRTLAKGKPGDAIVTEFHERKISLRLTLSGALVFNVGGFEFRAGKKPREFVEMIEDDILGHIDKFGQRIVFKMLPQIRGEQFPNGAVEKSRSRELCLRYLKRSAGIDPSILASVRTQEIFRIAEAVADDRYRLRSGKISEHAVGTMLERMVDRNAMTSQDANELYNALQGQLGNVPAVTMSQIVTRPHTSQMTNDVRAVHEFLGDLVFDEDPFEFEKARLDSSDVRVVAIMRKHVSALVKIARNPALLATFPQDIAGGITDIVGVFGGLLPMHFVRNVSDAELTETFMFLLDNARKTRSEQQIAVNNYVRQHPAPRPVSRQEQNIVTRIGGVISGFFTRKPERAAESEQSGAVLDSIKKDMLLAVLERISFAVEDADNRIGEAVSSAMVQAQQILAEKIGTQLAGDDVVSDPVWAMDFDEIVGGAMTDSGSGYGKFMHEVLTSYFVSSPVLDQRRMMASFIRHVDDHSSLGAMAGALFKGAGPLLQKMLQGLPPTSLGADLACALEDMKSNLLPIPDNYVKAAMNRIIERSEGKIRSIHVERSLGAASVGQAFLCKMITDNHPEGEECVVKLLRPTVKTAIVREREIFERAAANTPGMKKTFEGQLARILEELDFTLEAVNINFGRTVYEQPVYLRQQSILSNNEIQTLNLNSLHSMEVHPLVTPTMDCLVLKKAPGETYDRYMKDVERHFEDMMEGKTLENGRYHVPNLAELIHFRKELVGMYNETLKRQRFLIDLTKKWAHEGLFGGGFYHGDLHAGNIMTDGKGLTVIDFGNATHLTPIERGHVLRMISAALVGWNDMFESSFKELLSSEGKAAYDVKNVDGKISRDIAEVLKKGHGKDVGMRIAATLMLLQKHGIEVPGPIYNFNQCQMRLGGTVDAMNSLLVRLYEVLSKLEIPRIVYTVDRPECASMKMIAPAVKLVNELIRFVQRPFAGDTAAITAQQELEGALAEFNPMSKSDEMYLLLIEELKDEEHCREKLYPLIEQLQNMRALSNDGIPLKAAGAAFELKKEYESYLQKVERTDVDRKKLAVKIYRVINELYLTSGSLLDQILEGRPESFLMAVGDSISDSLYTVRTTLGNLTSIKLVNAQNAESDQIVREFERMSVSDLRVRSYRNAHPDSALDDYGIFVIKDVAGKMFLPFDLPGLDGSKKWLTEENSRKRIYKAIIITVKRLLPELERQRVFVAEQASEETRKEATCIALQYLVDRFGGLFDAFKDIDNRTQQRILAEVRTFIQEQAHAGVLAVNELEENCVMAGMLYLFQGGSQPAQEEPAQ